MNHAARDAARVRPALCLCLSISIVSALAAPALSEEVPELDVEEAVRLALRDHPDLVRARERLTEIGLQTREAWSAAFPQVLGQASAVRARDPGFQNQPGFEELGAGELPGGDPGDPGITFPTGAFLFNTYDYRVQLDQRIYSFGKVSKGIEASRANEGQVRESIRDLELTRGRAAALACYALARAEARAAAVRAERAALERQVEQARDFLEIGTGTRLQFLQARAALTALRPREIGVEGEIRAARVRLNEAVGRNPLEEVRVRPDLLERDELPDLPEVGALAEASRARADLRALESEREVIDLLRDIEDTNQLPEIKFSGSYGVRTIRTENLFRNDFVSWDAGVYLEWNLFDGGRTRARVQQLESQRRQNELQEAVRIGEITRELTAALVEYRRAREAWDAALEAIGQAEEARRVAVESRTWGAATLLEVLEAERTLASVREQRVEAAHDALAALVDIRFQVGLLPGEGFPAAEVDE